MGYLAAHAVMVSFALVANRAKGHSESLTRSFCHTQDVPPRATVDVTGLARLCQGSVSPLEAAAMVASASVKLKAKQLASSTQGAQD